MEAKEPNATNDLGASTEDSRRRTPRLETNDSVRVAVAAQNVEGVERNISAQGVYFVADAKLHVNVYLEGSEQPVAGELIRVENMGDGKLGFAVRFLGDID